MTPIERVKMARKIGYISGVIKALASCLLNPTDTQIGAVKEALEYLDELTKEVMDWHVKE
jgi:hypothetical protein